MEKLISLIKNNQEISSLSFKQNPYFDNCINGTDLGVNVYVPSFFEEKNLKEFKENLMKYKNIQILTLEINSSYYTEQTANLVQIASIIPSINTLLLSIKGGYNCIQPQIIKDTFSKFFWCTNLKKFSIKCDISNEKEAKELGLGLALCQTISNLAIEINKTNVSSLKWIREMNNLTTLTINVCPQNKIVENGAFDVAQAISKCNNLNQLFLKIEQMNMIQVQGAEYIGNSIGSLKKLQKLCLVISQQNNIFEEGAARLALAFQNGHSLNSLSLEIGSNLIGSKGVTALAKGISKCINMSSFHIILGSGNEVGIEGCKGLAEGIYCLNKLSNLGITIHKSNGIKDDGTVFLGQGISKLSNLTKAFISLKGNNVSRNGAISLRNALCECKRLHSLTVSINKDFATIFLKIPRIINFLNL